MSDDEPRRFLSALFDEAVRAVSAEAAMPAILPAPEGGRTLIVAAGKAAAAMTAAAVKSIEGDVFGVAVTRYAHSVAQGAIPASIDVIEAGHPVPDEAGMHAAGRALEFARSLTADDRLLMLISGGASSLLVLPAPGVSLAEKQEITKALLRSGAAIAEINCVRKHLSSIKGGRLAVAAAPASVTTLVISDVPGDDASFVGSGPTIADDTSLADARDILRRYGVASSPAIETALSDPANETPPPDAPGLADGDIRIIARARDALDAAARRAQKEGYSVLDLGDDLEGDAAQLGRLHAELARSLAAQGEKRLILSGGETTVAVRNRNGRGGRNLEYLLSLAVHLNGAPGISAIACDTDGIDGTEDNAGAIVTQDTLVRARTLGLDPKAFLAANDSYTLFAGLGDLVVTGPTRTNVNDFRAILVDP
ncbi:MAG: glycerate kinase [Pseudomonadota bacterium]|nr:glycerate kinase [Pseudomonadota bacterium]